MNKKKEKEEEQKKKKAQAERTECLERLCYLKVKKEEIELDLSMLQEDILAWPDRPGKDGVEVAPYGTLKLATRANWSVMKIPALFKKVGKDIFLEICKVTVGKLRKAVGTVGFKKLEKLGIIEQGADSEYFTLKRTDVMKKAVNGK